MVKKAKKEVKKKPSVDAKQTFQHWGAPQSLQYYFFLIFNVRAYLDKKRKNFKEMEIFINQGSQFEKKTSEQCRSHHQKQLSKFGGNVISLLLNFYRQFYIIRKIQIEHSYEEFQALIQEKPNFFSDKESPLQKFKDNWNFILNNLQNVQQVHLQNEEKAFKDIDFNVQQ